MSITMEAAVIEAAQPQCQFFVIRKKRLCRMTVRPGRQYCGEHEPQPPGEDQQIDKRVPCPNDPKHTCYISKLEKHLTKCNARQVEDPSYIIRNINASEDEDTELRLPLKDVPAKTLQQVIEKVDSLYKKHVKGTISTYTPPAEHHAAVAACIAQQDRTDSSRRHLRQASRLMQLAEDEGLVADNTCYVELGAGKGMLSYYMGCAWCGAGAGEGGDSRVVCVDRASLRHKRDNRVAERASRLRADLRHLALRRAPHLPPRAPVVGLAKHLCGVATDYALRCMAAAGARGVLLATCCHHRCERGAYVGARPLQELGVTGEELNVMFGVVSWATCGDGRGRDRRLAEDRLLSTAEPDAHIDTDAGSSEPEPSMLRQETDHLNLRESDENIGRDKKTDTNTNRSLSLRERDEGINDRKKSDPSDLEHSTSADATVQVSFPLPVNVREQIGRRAKALIDYGRVLYLREKGFETRLCYYVPTTESLENVCIVAKKDVW